MLVGYARVSTQDQNLELQLSALKKIGCVKFYQDQISGARNEVLSQKISRSQSQPLLGAVMLLAHKIAAKLAYPCRKPFDLFSTYGVIQFLQS